MRETEEGGCVYAAAQWQDTICLAGGSCEVPKSEPGIGTSAPLAQWQVLLFACATGAGAGGAGGAAGSLASGGGLGGAGSGAVGGCAAGALGVNGVFLTVARNIALVSFAGHLSGGFL